jgi:uncharacterized protein (DUF58 family)
VTETPLLDAPTLRQLERLRLRDLDAILRGLLGDSATGIGNGGRGVEFADYRTYVPGDELRRIDWNVYARLHQAFVRTSPQDSELGLALLLDGSRSMGEPGAPARRHAERVAALLGAVALLHGGSVQLTVLADGRAIDGEPLSGEQHVLDLVAQLDGLPHGRETDLAAGIRRRRPLAVVAEVGALLTDALIELPALDEALDALRALRAAVLLHVTTPVERDTDDGPIELVDSETGERLAVELTPQVLAEHAQRLDAHADAVAERCRAHGVGYVRMDAGGDAFDQVAALADAGQLLERER